MSHQTRTSDGLVALTPKQANIYVWGWQPQARFRDAVCGRRFGKTFLGKAEMRRAAKLAKDATGKLSQFESQFEGLDLEAVKGLLSKAGQDEETKLLTEGKVDEVFGL